MLKRLWLTARVGVLFVLGFVLFGFILSITTGSSPTFMIAPFIFLLIMSAVILARAYTETRNWIISVANTNNAFTINYLDKDDLRQATIAKSDIQTKLRWQGHKPEVLTLTIFDAEEPIVKVFGPNGDRDLTFEIENIAFQINEVLKKEAKVRSRI